MNPWQTWLQAIQNKSSTGMDTIMSNAAGNFSTQWESACKQWQANMESTWASPASYWQAVSSIQSARARTLATFWQQQPQYFAGLFQCTTFPQLVQHISRWNNAALAGFIEVSTITQSHRSNLTQQWQRQFSYLNTNTTLQGMWTSGQQAAKAQPTITPFQMPAQQGKPQATTTAAPSSIQQPQPKAETQQASPKPEPKIEIKAEAKPEPKSEPIAEIKAQPVPQPAPKIEAKPIEQQAPQIVPQVIQQVIQQVATQPTVTAMPMPMEQPQLLTGTHSGPIANTMPSGIMSSTATSVMRTAGGSTIAAAAARRSVVARRASSRRRAPR